ncbi:hypothetical protein SAMN04487938_1934 [Lysobacter sp. cf310]|nr:hypothetical protein SAMN04487938_1934 [Lysobacter sp. cf310]
MDQTQNKAREIDLVAEKAFEIQSNPGQRFSELVVRLFVECKFIQGHSVFWLSDKDEEAAERLVCHQGGGFRPYNSYTKRHHYLSEAKKVAKLFATTKSPEQDPFYKALNQVLNAQVSMKGQQLAVIDGSTSTVGGVLNYPVIVCSTFDGVYATDFLSHAEPTPLQENFQLEVQYAYANSAGSVRDEYFLIDIVEFAQLQSFSEALDRDAKSACMLLSRG